MIVLPAPASSAKRAAWKRQRITLSFAEQCRDLTALRQEEEAPLPAQAAQHTLKRVERAFQAFFRRIRAGETPGYPRFKAQRRFKGWSYPTHGTGWRLLPRKGLQHGRLRLSGIGHVRIRGDARTAGEPKTCDITYRHGKWYASITLACQPQRACGSASLAFDWGIETFATIATDDGGLQSIENPRFLRQNEETLKAAYRARDSKHQFSRGWRIANKRIARLHGVIARQRKDFQHKQSAQMISAAGAIFTETRHVKNMVTRPKPKLWTAHRRNFSACCGTKRQKLASCMLRPPPVMSSRHKPVTTVAASQRSHWRSAGIAAPVVPRVAVMRMRRGCCWTGGCSRWCRSSLPGCGFVATEVRN